MAEVIQLEEYRAEREALHVFERVVCYNCGASYKALYSAELDTRALRCDRCRVRAVAAPTHKMMGAYVRYNLEGEPERVE